MTRIRSFVRIAAVASLAAVLALPVFAQRGKADFTMFVAIGDSYGAGFSSGSLNERHQPYGWPAIVAKQAGLHLCPTNAAITDHCFAVPFISYPGIPPELILTLAGPTSGTGQGAPLMSGFGRPYNNLAVPGYTIGAALALTGSEANSGLGQVILRGLGSEVDQAIRLNPTFIGVWIGGNDFLGAVSQGKPSLLTSTDAFRTQYNGMLDKLIAAAPNAGMVVGSLPANFLSAPLTSALPAVVFDANLQPVIIGGGTVPLIGDLGGGTVGPLPAGSIVLLSAIPAIQSGVGIPPALKSFPPFNQMPNVGTPLSDAQVILPAERTQFEARIAEFNQVITQAAQTRSIPVADIKGLFDRFAATSGVAIGPFLLTHQYVRGGLFSLDGVHPTDIGYALFANEFIKAINSAYGTRIPLASVSQFLQNNDPATAKVMGLTFDEAVAQQMIQIFNSATVTPAPPRRLKASH